MTVKQPTAQGISRLLGKAGIARSETHSNGRIKGLTEHSAGYVVTREDGSESVRVKVTPGTFNRGPAARQRADDVLSRCADVIRAAGWTVTADNYGAAPNLVISAPSPDKPEEGNTR
jgi:hypothetical protein